MNNKKNFKENITHKKASFDVVENGIKIKVNVIPGSSRSEICEIMDDGIIKIKLNSPPVDGQANKECIKLLSKRLKVPKSSIQIINGQNSRNKTIFIAGEIEDLINFNKN